MISTFRRGGCLGREHQGTVKWWAALEDLSHDTARMTDFEEVMEAAYFELGKPVVVGEEGREVVLFASYDYGELEELSSESHLQRIAMDSQMHQESVVVLRHEEMPSLDLSLAAHVWCGYERRVRWAVGCEIGGGVAYVAAVAVAGSWQHRRFLKAKN